MRNLLPLLFVVSFLFVASSSLAQEPLAEREARGEYLAHHVAMCVICHSPRDARGQIVRQRAFQGGDIPMASPYEGEDWAFEAPNIAGGATLPRADLVELLMTGQDSTGWSPRPPMPPFRMSQEDAAAVADYLRSLE